VVREAIADYHDRIGKLSEDVDRIPRARSREIDLAIAATPMVRDAALWTLNTEDFQDIPGLKLV
jgi:predicted nucleic acid-binding protein